MPDPFFVEHRVQFRDTDAAGIMHFSAFLTYMEESEHEFLRSIGLSVINCEIDGVHISWPRVSVHCDFQAPLRFEQLFRVKVSIGRLGSKSVTYHFDFLAGEKVCASGLITAACCELTDQGIRGIEIPESIREKFSPFLDSQS